MAVLQSLLSEFNSLSISLTAFLAGSLLVLLISVYVLRRQIGKMRRDAEQMKKVQQDLRALVTASVGMGERMREVERRNRRLAKRQEQFDIHDAANQPYEQAIRMVKNGANTTELVSMCGLSQSEADLIRMIHNGTVSRDEGQVAGNMSA